MRVGSRYIDDGRQTTSQYYLDVHGGAVRIVDSTNLYKNVTTSQRNKKKNI